MKPTDEPSARPTMVCCDVLALGCVRVTAEQLPALRHRPGPGAGAALPSSFLKHADEQTVTGLAAVLQAIHQSRLSETRFADWGVVAAPCFLGRATLASALRRYAAEGAWGISPHFIPHRSQHAVSGTISQVLKIHGPNFGTGGGPGGTVEALLAGAILVGENRVPGVWVVLTGWHPEAIPDREGRTRPDGVCHALALALAAARAGWQGPQLRVVPWVQGNGSEPGGALPMRTPGNLEAFFTTLASLQDAPAAMLVWQLHGGGWVELRQGGSGGRGTPPGAVSRSVDLQWVNVP